MEFSWLDAAQLAGLDIVLMLILALFALDGAESLYRRWHARRMDRRRVYTRRAACGNQSSSSPPATSRLAH